MEDKEIIALYWAREESAIHETDVKYGAYLSTIAFHIVRTKEDSEECVNDTYLRTWDAIPPARPDVLKLFLAKITRNLCINVYKAKHALKRGGGEIELVLDELTECVSGEALAAGRASAVYTGGDSGPEQEMIAQELAKEIRDFTASLPARDADVFVRRYFFTEPVREIALRYGMSENHVSVLLNRLRKRLKEQLTEAGYAVS